jgi:hypothetical protein
MKSRLVIFLLLFVLNFEANKIVGAVDKSSARVIVNHNGQWTCPLPLQINSSPEFMPLSPDGVAAIKRQRRKRRRRNSQRRAKVYGIKVTPEEVGGAPPPPPPEPVPQEEPTMAAPPPVQASPGMDMPGRSTHSKKSAPKIKPPTVQIKPPTK